MQNKESPKLRECPFCGCSYEKDPDDYVYAGNHEKWCPLSNTGGFSGSNMVVIDDPEYIEAWNRRAGHG